MIVNTVNILQKYYRKTLWRFWQCWWTVDTTEGLYLLHINGMTAMLIYDEGSTRILPHNTVIISWVHDILVSGTALIREQLHTFHYNKGSFVGVIYSTVDHYAMNRLCKVLSLTSLFTVFKRISGLLPPANMLYKVWNWFSGEGIKQFYYFHWPCMILEVS